MRQSTSMSSFTKVAKLNRILLWVLLSLTLLVALPAALSSQTASGSISVSPVQVEIGTSPTVILTASGFFDLSSVEPSQLGISPNQGISNLRITSATAQRMSLSFEISADASEGIRTLFIKDQSGARVVALDLLLKLPRHICRPACTGTTSCRNNHCEFDHTICTPQCGFCERCVANFCSPKVCSPACNTSGTPPEVCECGQCVPQN